MKKLLLLTLIFFSNISFAQSWLDVFNRYRVAQASDWLTPVKIPRNDLRPFVTLARRNQQCSDCIVENLGDSGRFALAMQGQGSRKDSTAVRNEKGETLLTSRDMDFLRTHAWDGAGKVFIGGTVSTPRVSPQSLVMALVTQIGVRGRPIAIGFVAEEEDLLLWSYRLLPLAESDIKEAVVRDGRLVYPVTLRFNIYFHEAIEDASLPAFDFQSSRDQIYSKRTRVGRFTSALTFKSEFTFDQPVQIVQNGFRAEGLGRLLDPGRWIEGPEIDHLWVGHAYGSSASEHPALTPKALLLIENGTWSAPELTKRLTSSATFKRAYDAFPWMRAINYKDYQGDLEAQRLIIAKRIEHAFHRRRMAVKVWSKSIVMPKSEQDLLKLDITFYGNYDQSKILKVFENMRLQVDFSDSY